MVTEVKVVVVGSVKVVVVGSVTVVVPGAGTDALDCVVTVTVTVVGSAVTGTVTVVLGTVGKVAVPLQFDPYGHGKSVPPGGAKSQTLLGRPVVYEFIQESPVNVSV